MYSINHVLCGLIDVDLVSSCEKRKKVKKIKKETKKCESILKNIKLEHEDGLWQKNRILFHINQEKVGNGKKQLLRIFNIYLDKNIDVYSSDKVEVFMWLSIWKFRNDWSVLGSFGWLSAFAFFLSTT
ncbi:hypothetical protein ACJX0J_019822, partial [Zea mays]